MGKKFHELLKLRRRIGFVARAVCGMHSHRNALSAPGWVGEGGG